MAFANSKEYLSLREAKKQKLNENLTFESNLFHGKHFYFNGFLGNSTYHLELKAMIVKNGGICLSYLTSQVNVVVANILCASKQDYQRNIGKKKRDVVTSEWVIDSIQAGFLLPVNAEKYQCVELRNKDQPPLNFGLGDAGFSEEEYSDPESFKSLPLDNGDSVVHDNKPLHMELNIVGEHLDEKIDNQGVAHHRPKSYKCTDPNFIENFFNSSRLHHLSTWKTELIQLTKSRMTELHRTAAKKGQDRVIMHVDMDCFFATVACRNRPDLVNKFVCVSHGGKRASTAELACVNYASRSIGLKNGMFLGPAIEIVENYNNKNGTREELVVLDYDFDAISKCSKLFYETVIQFGGYVMAVSCDEVLIDATDIVIDERPLSRVVLDIHEEKCIEIAESLRKSIFVNTEGCIASIGIGLNRLQARIATKKAKPNGVFILQQSNIQEILDNMPVGALPGVGWKISKQMAQSSLKICGDLRKKSLGSLQDEYGAKKGQTLFDFVRGVDDRILENNLPKRVSSEINFAIRFSNTEEVRKFVQDLAAHVHGKMVKADLNCNTVSLSLKERNYIGEPSKFMGCGHCIDYHKSVTGPFNGAGGLDFIYRSTWKMVVETGVKAAEIRGLGIHLSQVGVEGGQRILNFESTGPTPVRPVNKTLLEKILEKERERERQRKDFEERRRKKQKNDQLLQHFENDKRDAYFLEKYGVKPSDIDQSMLSELPLDILSDLHAAGFGNDLNEEVISQRDFCPTFSQLDDEILKNLPLDVQKEVREAALIETKKRKRPSVEEPIATPSRQETPHLAGEEHSDTIFSMIKSWVSIDENSSDAVPEPEDIQHFSKYLCLLIFNCNTQIALRLLRYVHRAIKGRAKWEEAMEYVTRDVQKTLSLIFGIDFDFNYQGNLRALMVEDWPSPA